MVVDLSKDRLVDSTVPGSPGWWMVRLRRELTRKAPRLRMLERYDSGEHPCPTGVRSARSWQDFIQRSRTNYVGLANASVWERMVVAGFRTGADSDEGGDQKAYDIWQASDMASESALVHAALTTYGEAYTITGPVPDDGEWPLITAESPLETITAHDPRHRRRVVAAVKTWTADDGSPTAVLHLPGEVWTAVQGVKGLEWVDLEAEGSGLDRVPVVRHTGQRRLTPVRTPKGHRTDVLAEAETALDIQDRINGMTLDRLVTSAAQAFRQRWVKLGGTPDEDTPAELETALRSDPGAVWALYGDAEFGDFQATDLTPMLAASARDVQEFAAVTRTPAEYFPALMNVSDTAVEQAMSGKNAKILARIRDEGGSWRMAMSLAFEFLGDARRQAVERIEVLWEPPELIPLSTRADAAAKLVNSVLPPESVMRMVLQMSPSEIARALAEKAAAELEAQPEPVVGGADDPEDDELATEPAVRAAGDRTAAA